jgi:hypothetical protein
MALASPVVAVYGRCKEKNLRMKRHVQLANAAILVMLLLPARCVLATTLPYDVRTDRPPVVRDPGLGQTWVIENYSPTARGGGNVIPVLSAITSGRDGVQATTLISRTGFMPEFLDRSTNRHPKPPPIETTADGRGKGRNPKAVPDGGLTAGLLGMGLFGTVWMKRKLAKWNTAGGY